MVLALPKKRDIYTKKAKSEGYRSRAAYKLLQIDKKFKIFQGEQTVIDLCGAPGGFSQIARDRSHGKARIFLVDIARIKPIPNITDIIKGDITKPSTILQIQQSLEKHGADDNDIIILADCSPDVSGHWTTDHARQIWLAETALGISNYFLAKIFVTKVFQGEQYQELLEKIKGSYQEVKAYKPPTSRKKSAEIYIIAISNKNKSSKRYNRLHLVESE
ncbi:MAG: RlmE family RNA methyltransferase [Candidatus Heimdallarchaeota archaeon]|nr:MAG: RlmE family RNA methyltransferase [Candidatus Heimdallarchaeota archaeon]